MPGPDNLCSLLDGVAAGDPARPALVVSGRTTTFRELADATVRAGAALAGDAPAGNVALSAPAGAATVAALLGVAGTGGAAALLNPQLTVGERHQLCRLVGAEGELAPDEAWLEGPVTAPPGWPAPGGERSALVLFTSGTTGLPKPVPISHRALAERLLAYSGGFDPAAPVGVRLMAAPLFHIGGLLGLLLSLWAGHTTVVQPRFDAGEWLALVEEHRVDSAFVVPTMLHRIVEHPDLARRDVSSLKALAYGAAAAPVDLVRRAMDAFPGTGFANTFGQTETLGGYTALTPADHRDPARIGSVGRALPGVQVRVVAPGTDDDLPSGEVGELLVLAPQNVTPGWLRTGDLGRVDGDGYVYPMGRLSDTINRGGEKFGPSEIEAVLRRHPGVADAGVAGAPDPEMGERVVAAVVAADGEVDPEELRAHCRRHLAPFKVPERIAVVASLPYNDLGKLRRPDIVRVVVGPG